MSSRRAFLYKDFGKKWAIAQTSRRREPLSGVDKYSGFILFRMLVQWSAIPSFKRNSSENTFNENE